MKRLLVLLSTVALLLPANAFARGEFDPTKEFVQHEWVPIHLGPLVGWAAGSIGYGLAFGAVDGIPVGVATTVIKYRHM